MYCHPDFKKMMDIRRIEYGSKDSIKFTKKVASNPEILKGSNNEKKKTVYKKPSFF